MNLAAAEIERVARLSYGRLVAILAARTGRVAAVDALSDALLRALETWPERGIPDRPEAWLLAAARNRMTDAGRRARLAEDAAAHLALLEEERAAGDGAADPLLGLMFVCAHPAIDRGMRTPLMLQLVLGLDARRMAGIFLVAPGTLGQRLTRARAKIEAARIGFSPPEPGEIPARLAHVLDAIYAAYTVGADGHGTGDLKAMRLAPEAVWLASLLAAQMPHEPEAQALLALMLYAEARRPARADGLGRFVPLDAQDPSLWDARLLADADRALRNASAAATLGRFQLEAAIQAAHMDRRHRPVDRTAIVTLYRGLFAIRPTLGARTALAATLAEVGAVAEGLALLDAADPTKAAAYQPYWAVRAHLLARVGEAAGAAAAYDRAIALASDTATRAYLLRRRMDLPPANDETPVSHV